MKTRKVQVYQFEELTGNALENAKNLLKNLQDNCSENYFWSFAREDMETDLVDCLAWIVITWSLDYIPLMQTLTM